MEKNIAALLRQDAKTVAVQFTKARVTDDLEVTRLISVPINVDPNKSYTYVTDLDLKVDDLVVVPAKGFLTLGLVSRVDAEVQIQPDAEIKYQWVVSRVELAPARLNLSKNTQIEEAVAQGYRRNLRASFAQQILGAMTDEARGAVQHLLGSN